MEIIPYHQRYRRSITRMLFNAGIPKKDMCFESNPTFCVIGKDSHILRGFYTEKQDESGLTLKHFYVGQWCRNGQVALKLWLHFKNRHTKTVAMWNVNINKTDERLKKFLHLTTNVLEKYYSNEHEDFYLVSFGR